MRLAAAVAFLAAWSAAVAAAQADEGVAIVTLENGASIGFALIRTGGQKPGGAIGEAALPRSNSVNRVLWDRESGAYFGYRVVIETQGGSRPLRVAFKPLDRKAVERELRGSRGDCPHCPTPSPLGTAGPQFPPAQQLAEGEALTLELLANPTTGERILDVVKLSLKPISGEAMHAAASRALEGQHAVARAAAFVVRGNFPAAIDEYKKAIEVAPNDARLHNLLGICYQSSHDEGRALREYERALELDPKYASAWNNIGTLEQSRRRFRAAVKAYKKAIGLKPTLATAWRNMGTAYLALSQFERAFEALQEAFRLDPSILETQGSAVASAGVDAATQYFYLAKLLAANGHKDAALDYLRRAKDAGFRDFDRVEADKDFHPLLQDARYKELARR